MTAPRVEFRGVEKRASSGSGLIEQHDYGFAHPEEDFHLWADIARRLRRFGRVDEIEHHVRVVAHVFQRLLAAPERAVSDAVPGLRKEPYHRIALALQAFHQSGTVAEAGRIPQAHHEAARLDQREGFVHQRHVRRVAHLPHILAQQRAGQRRLAGIRVGNEAQCDDVGGITHARLPLTRWRWGRSLESGKQGGHK